MKKFIKLFVSFLCAAVIAVPVLFCVACDNNKDKGDDNTTVTPEPSLPNPEDWIDYVSDLKLDFTTNTKKQEVKVRLFVDGDTTHFNPVSNSQYTDYNASDFAGTDDYIKARYLAINTPESTGKIEEWGKKASNFTHTKLENAKTIIVESDDNKWNIDSTGERYLLWIWYLNEGEAEFRNLNVEILQEGLAIGSSTANNRYGQIAMAALNQAKAFKKYVHSGEPDPDFPYGEAVPVTLKVLRCHIEEYANKKVKVTGVVTTEFNNSVYLEEYDPETGVNFGISVYYGYSSGSILNVLSVGNEVSVVGVVSYYEGGDSYQISGVKHDAFHPNDPDNSTILSTGKSASFVETSAKDIVSGKLNVYFDIEDEDGEVVDTETVTLNYADAIMSTTVTVSNLTVIDVYTTKKGNSAGAMSITCRAEDGTEIVIRTEVLKDKNGNLLTEDMFTLNETVLTVKGMIEKYEGNYQVKCYRADYLIVVE